MKPDTYIINNTKDRREGKTKGNIPHGHRLQKSYKIANKKHFYLLYIKKNWYIKQIMNQDQKGFIRGVKCCFKFWKIINLINHINRIKGRRIWLLNRCRRTILKR